MSNSTMTTNGIFNALYELEVVKSTKQHMPGTNEQRFFLRLVNDKRLELVSDEEEVIITVWENWDDEDEDWDDKHIVSPGEAPQLLAKLGTE